jgi:hypothetical protein
MKTYVGVKVVSLTPRPLHSKGKSPRYSYYRRLGGPQSRAGWALELIWALQRGEKSCLCRQSNFSRPARSPLARRYTDWAINVNIATVPKRIARKAYRGIELKLYSYKLFEVNEIEWSASLSGRFISGERIFDAHLMPEF